MKKICAKGGKNVEYASLRRHLPAVRFKQILFVIRNNKLQKVWSIRSEDRSTLRSQICSNQHPLMKFWFVSKNAPD